MSECVSITTGENGRGRMDKVVNDNAVDRSKADNGREGGSGPAINYFLLQKARRTMGNGITYFLPQEARRTMGESPFLLQRNTDPQWILAKRTSKNNGGQWKPTAQPTRAANACMWQHGERLGNNYNERALDQVGRKSQRVFPPVLYYGRKMGTGERFGSPHTRARPIAALLSHAPTYTSSSDFLRSHLAFELEQQRHTHAHQHTEKTWH